MMPTNNTQLSYLESENPLMFHSYSGSDMQCVIRMDRQLESSVGKAEDIQQDPVYQFAELQTLSISTFRSVHPVRRLGESQPAAYTRGARTIGGTLVFAQFANNAFEKMYRLSTNGEVYEPGEPFFVDQLPEFDIIVSATNEYGISSNLIVGGITLQQTGTTLSVHDLYTEATYGWVGRFYIPLSQVGDYRKLMREVVTQPPGRSGSSLAKDAIKHMNNQLERGTISREEGSLPDPIDILRMLYEATRDPSYNPAGPVSPFFTTRWGQ